MSRITGPQLELVIVATGQSFPLEDHGLYSKLIAVAKKLECDIPEQANLSIHLTQQKTSPAPKRRARMSTGP